ncbi:hypothetical protein J1605_010372 [Eschrichtius robustus]|uniref:Myelin basic protein n=1 Tax=Eschrichtius robustus TaxID=9764 RepID=A0AB34GU59_ESCRO|nr:hypothetical protein J1605_010372 [Eschrichtius robustus]
MASASAHAIVPTSQLSPPGFLCGEPESCEVPGPAQEREAVTVPPGKQITCRAGPGFVGASEGGAASRGAGGAPSGAWPSRREGCRGGVCSGQEDGHHAARATHYGSLPPKAQHGRPQDENPVVHFFKNIVTPRTPPPSQGKGRGLSLSRFSWGAEGPKPGFGYGGRASDYKSAHKGLKGHDAQGTLSRIFKLGGRDGRSGSPMARR